MAEMLTTTPEIAICVYGKIIQLLRGTTVSEFNAANCCGHLHLGSYWN
jgi:hypothetical protein